MRKNSKRRNATETEKGRKEDDGSMRIIFMGTPGFAAESLKALLNSEHEVSAVFTQPDKPRGRGKKITFSPVKSLALEHGIEVLQPISFKASPQTYETIREYNPDCIAVAAYGMILPPEVLEIPKYGCINVHASLLPKYRGAAPINRCIMDGETESGVTIMQMSRGLDTGDMLLKEKTAIGENMTATELHDILAETGGRLLVKALDSPGDLRPEKQDNSKASYASMIVKDECEAEFSRPAKEIFNFIRGLSDYPCAYTFLGGKRVKIYRAVIGEAHGGISFKCGDGEIISLTEIQPEGKNRMESAEFLKGYKI
jgi:methionyl-tRNA formyltransferase